MATITDSIQYTLEQKIVPTIYEAGWELDPIYPMMARTSMGVVRNQHGRGWNVLKTWVTGLAGGAKFTSAQGSNVLSGLNNLNIYDTANTFQALDETVAPGFIQTTTGLIEHRGNFYLPHHIMRADRLTASIGSVVSQNLRGVGELLTQQESAVFYTTAPSTFALAGIGDTSATVTNKASDTTAMVFNLAGTNATGRVHRFRPGMLVDLYDSTGATKRNSGYTLVIDNVDPLAQTIEIRRVDGGTFQTTTSLNGGVTYATAGGDNDIVVIKDSVATAPNALESWIADGTSVTTFFGIAVADHGQYKSYVPSSIGAALTENLMNKYVGFFYESFPGKKLDAAITTMGVLNGFIDNLDSGNQAGSNAASGRNRYDRNSQALNVMAGWDAFNYRFASRTIEIYTSTYCAKGTLYAGRLRNGGITRYVPPAIPGAKTDKRFGAEVEFVAPLGGTGGYQGIFKHAHASNGATTDFIEAPFLRQWNCMPVQPNFMKLLGITEVLG